MEEKEKKIFIKKVIKKFAPYIVILAETIALIAMGAKNSELETKYRADEDYIIAQASKTFEYYGEKDVILMDDYTYGEVWLAALEDVPLCSYDYSRLKRIGDFKYYNDENGHLSSRLGVDVSYFQGDIDWAMVKECGIDFAMLRVGYRGYETGSLNEDKRFREYIEGALEAGINVGVYFYSQAVSVEEAEEEADFVLSMISDYDITYPVAYDWEIVGESNARTNDMPAQMLTDCTYAFCSRISKAGYIPMIYSVKKQALMKTDMSALAGFEFWLAEYKDKPTYPYEFGMWQYASDAEIDGIKGSVDINLSFADYAAVRTGRPSEENTE